MYRDGKQSYEMKVLVVELQEATAALWVRIQTSLKNHHTL
jgi:hypothetical protein